MIVNIIYHFILPVETSAGNFEMFSIKRNVMEYFLISQNQKFYFVLSDITYFNIVAICWAVYP